MSELNIFSKVLVQFIEYTTWSNIPAFRNVKVLQIISDHNRKLDEYYVLRARPLRKSVTG